MVITTGALEESVDDLTNADGVVIAWLSDSGCENKACLKAVKDGRPIHIIPTHMDPRAADFHLVLPTWHYRDRDEAVKALEDGWAAASPVFTRTDRDVAYAQNVPV